MNNIKKSKKTQIAILQNRVNVGGRSKVVAEIIQTLDKKNLCPDVLSFSTDAEIDNFASNYNLQGYFKHIRILPIGWNKGTTYQMPILNLSARNKLKQYDFVINSNNVPYLLPEGPKYLHYMHFPPEAAFEYNERLKSSLKMKAYTSPLKFLYSVLSLNEKKSIFLANSEFTKKRILEFYDFEDKEVSVVYPPCLDNIDVSDNYSSSSKVVSLGSFTPNKRQLDQIEIAKQLPNLEFSIIGMNKNTDYFDKCQSVVDEEGLENVNLFPDLEWSLVKKKLDQAEFFLHTMHNEPFGIATVEAIFKGCLPIVHNSGGQKEIVHQKRLRFNSVKEAVTTLQTVKNMDYSDKRNSLKQLQESLDQYTKTKFQEKISRQISKITT